MSTFIIYQTYDPTQVYVNNKIIGIEVLEVSNKKDAGVLVRTLRSPRTTSCQYGWVIHDVCI